MTTEPAWKKKVEAFRAKFVAREDTFGIRNPFLVTETNVETGEKVVKEKANIMPACANFGDPALCQITQRRGGCADCNHKLYKTVTDEETWKHLSGAQEMILYMLRPDGTIRFGAADFDRGTQFEDAKAVRDASLIAGIPCYIARSTQKGYHVYWFFTGDIPAHEFTSYVRYLYEECGFYQRWEAAPEVGLPETFPKQTTLGEGKLGNGIKVPMMEPRMREGRNCWVDDDAEPLALDQQWPFFEAMQSITPEQFAEVLTTKNVEILKAPASKNRQSARKAEGKEAGEASAVKPFGDFWSIVEGCPAMREYWQKDAKGNYVWDITHGTKLSYEAYYASLLLGATTVNGIDVVKSRYKDSDTAYQINYALENSYTPMTCVTMQQKGACVPNRHPKCGDHCIKRLPPTVYEEGKRVVNPDNLPEDQWPDPSPIRFATDRNLTTEDYIEKIGDLFANMKKKAANKPDDLPGWLPEKPEIRVQGLIESAKKNLEATEYARVRGYITANKLMKVKELDIIEKSGEKKNETKKQEKLRTKYRSFKFGNEEFFEKDGGYLKTWRDAKGNLLEEQMTNFTVLIQEERVAIRISDHDDLSSQSVAEDRSFHGTISVGNQKLPFDPNYREWMTSPDTFFKTLVKYAGGALLYKRASFDQIRNCINWFSNETVTVRKVSRQIGYHKLKNRPVYLMPSVIIDKDSIKANDEFTIAPFNDDPSKCLDFKVISDDELKDLGRHIIHDYFACNNAILTMTTFAHAMAAAMIPQFSDAGFTKGPILWLAGSQGGGKSFVAEAAQYFFGQFDIIQNASGTAKSKLSTGYNFRHAFMLIDDYKKALNDPFGKEFPQLLQNAYDRSGRTALQRNGEARHRSDRVRGLLAITGEDVVESEASSLARTILVDVPYKGNRTVGEFVKLRRSEYSGFTPHFIQFVLGLTKEEIKGIWSEYYEEFFRPIELTYAHCAPDRIAENITMNMVAFRIAMEMLVAKGVIPEVERDELCRIHQGNLTMVRSTILEAVTSNTGAHVFLNALAEIIQNPVHCVVYNWPGYDEVQDITGSSKVIGFYRESTPDIVYLYPQLTHGVVANHVKQNNNHVQSIGHISRQLFDEGFLDTEKINRDKSEYVVHIRGPAKASVRAWPLKLSALGYELTKDGRMSQAKPKKGRNPGQPDLTVIPGLE